VLWSTLNRTIFWELIRVFVIALISITGLLLLAVVVMEAQNQGLGPLQILAIIPLVIPSTMPYTIPATTLFATCVVYGRLAHDNEVLAVRAAGISVLRLVRPAVLLGLAMSAVTAVLYYEVIPSSYNMMKSLFLSEPEKLLYQILTREGRFFHPKLDYAITVKKVEDRKLINPTFMHRDPNNPFRYDIVAQAREAELRVDSTNKKILVHMRLCYITSSNGTAFVEEEIWPVDFPTDFLPDRKLRRSDMTWNELLERLELLKQQERDKDLEIAKVAAHFSLSNAPDNLAKHLENLRNEKKEKQQQIREIEAELQRRPALAVGCLCFVLIGCPVGMWFSRSDYLSAFVTCFLPIVLVYYPLVLCGENLAKAGSLNPVMALWAADGLMGLIALSLYWRLIRH
jgi:lipopolysaccharide export system permease protein